MTAAVLVTLLMAAIVALTAVVPALVTVFVMMAVVAAFGVGIIICHRDVTE